MKITYKNKMASQTKPWNLISHYALGGSCVIGIIVFYDDYFDCFTDTEFKFGEDVDYNLEILNSLNFCKLNNSYGSHQEINPKDGYIKFVFEEFARPIWSTYLK